MPFSSPSYSGLGRHYPLSTNCRCRTVKRRVVGMGMPHQIHVGTSATSPCLNLGPAGLTSSLPTMLINWLCCQSKHTFVFDRSYSRKHEWIWWTRLQSTVVAKAELTQTCRASCEAFVSCVKPQWDSWSEFFSICICKQFYQKCL